jgi:hypothetical protein
LTFALRIRIPDPGRFVFRDKAARLAGISPI